MIEEQDMKDKKDREYGFGICFLKQAVTKLEALI